MNKTKIIISSNSGFCFGVKRALNIAEAALKKKKKVYSLGPIIHNPQVVRDFSGKGLKIVKDARKIASRKAAILVPSHGMSPGVLKNKKVTCIDTTCPLVSRVQKIVKALRRKGYLVVIVGDRKHPEVRALAGIAPRNHVVLKDKKHARDLDLKCKKIAVVSQTTASLSSFKEILSEIAKKDVTELVGFNTVCKNTIDRQREAEHIAGSVEAMFVIGGKQSANTSRLADTCRRVNKHTYHIESGKDLKKKFFKGRKSIGIVTGASTPPYALKEVIKKIKED
ncbi:MAG: 4-hydroxy-3-methylbut-2-enyl diphosphate reductase [Candidatus Omnitrophota bacterium]